MRHVGYFERLKQVRDEYRRIAVLPAELKNEVLRELARLLVARSSDLLAANEHDLLALPADASSAFRDRLALNEKRVELMAESLRQVAFLPDPVGEVVEERSLANGLRVRRMRSPLGVILMIFESRPNVALESFALAFKAGNAIWLRGGKESRESVTFLVRMIQEALTSKGAPETAVTGVLDPDRALARELLQQKKYFDVVVPRGGDALIEFVVENSKIPIVKNDRGMCHVYLHADADLAMAARIVENAKTQRPGVCNAMETLLVHASAASTALPLIFGKLKSQSVEWFACPRSKALLPGEPSVGLASPVSFDTEYLALKMNCKVVDDLDEAITHIAQHGSGHSEAIITASEEVARRFQSEVDAAAVYWNASTRFTDGFELGLGGELGISTQKLHVRGPVGLRELTSVRWVFDGNGQVRE